MSVTLAIANIALDTASVSRQGFGTILFISEHTYFAERTRLYSSTKAMVDDGIETTSAAYAAGVAAFSQNPSPVTLMIGRAEALETAPETLAAIQAENDSFYYITAEDHTETYVTAMCADVEAKLKYYRYSTADTDSLIATPTGAIAVPAANNYDRSSGVYHQDADTKFPEVAALAEIVFATTGTVTYSNRQVAGVAPSKNALGNDITLTEQTNLRSVNGDFFARVGASDTDPSIIVVGKSGSGEWIDNIVTRDNMQVDIVADFTNFLINQKAGKVPYNNTGIAQAVGILSNTLNPYTTDGTHNFIEPDFTIEVADISDISDADKAARVFKQITFVATLTGAINTVEITGTLTL